MEILNSLPNNISMKTKIWGPTAWFFLHSAAMAYPKKIDPNNSEDLIVKKSMKEFLINFGNILPCPICGESYNRYILENKYNIDNALDGRNELFYWTYIIHERVNDKLGVPVCDRPSYSEVIKKYYSFIAKNGCKATTELEKNNKRNVGCTDFDFSEHKCVINIEEKSKRQMYKINSKDIFILLLIVILLILIRKLMTQNCF